MKRSILFAAMGFSTLPAFADYTVQLGLGVSAVDDSKDYSSTVHSNFESDGLVSGARVYFGSVDTSNSPISEAGFLAKKSSITATNEIYKQHLDYNYTYRNEPTSQSYDSHRRETQLDYRGVYDNVIVNLSSELIYREGEKSASLLEAGAGYYILDNAAITGRLIRLGRRNGDDDIGVGVNYKHIFLPQQTTAFGLEVDAFSVDDYFATTVEGSVHFTPSTELSIGIAYSHNSDDESDEKSSKNTIKLSAKHFFVETIGVEVGYSYGDHNSHYDDQEADEVSLNLFVNI